MDCPICLESIYKREACVTACNHIFHAGCLYLYAQACGSPLMCPQCRQRIAPPMLKVVLRNTRLPCVEEWVFAQAVDWSDNKTFVAGGFAVDAYNYFRVGCTDIDIFTTDLSRINLWKLVGIGYSIAEMFTAGASSPPKGSGLSSLSGDACRDKKLIRSVYKLVHPQYRNIDVVLVCDTGRLLIQDVLDRFDLSCCKIALILDVDDTTPRFYLHPDIDTNTYRLCGTEAAKQRTLQRVDKYRSRGFALEHALRCRCNE